MLAELKPILNKKVAFYNNRGFIDNDPISIPHRFSKKEDIEISGFLSATLAWGNRKSIINSAKTLMLYMDNAPYDFIQNFREADLRIFESFAHRTFNGDDCVTFLWSLKHIYEKYGGLENAFSGEDPRQRIIQFRKKFFEKTHLQRTLKHVSDPGKNSAAKRINMFLRWMVRKDGQGVDFGVWESISASNLMCPLDIHSGRTARKLGLLQRKPNDWKAVEELTANLKILDPDDPVKYDYALFGIGVHEKLSSRL